MAHPVAKTPWLRSRPASKLTEADVREIRAAWGNGRDTWDSRDKRDNKGDRR
jgi:hypothetical protein